VGDESLAAALTDQAVHVLVVEDDASIARQLVSGLRREGYLVTHVASGGEALAEELPDLVLLDLGLPDADGLDVGDANRAAFALDLSSEEVEQLG